MNDKIKNAFDGIYAEEQLKNNTLAFLQSRIHQQIQDTHRAGSRHLAVVLTCFMVLALTGVFSYNIYFTEAMYVDVDINPSIELTINHFDRIVGVYAYNADGEALLAQLELLHRSYDSALALLTETAIEKGFLLDGGLMSVTLQSGSRADEDVILEVLQANILSAAKGHHASVWLDAFPVDGDTRELAHEQNLSPAKHLAILELQAVDPTATAENCRNDTIGKIRERTQEHSSRHHGKSDNYTVSPGDEEVQNEDNDIPLEEDTHRNGHHGNRHK